MVVRIDQVEVAITVQIAKRRPKTHSALVQTPGGTDVFKFQVTPIAEGEVGFGQKGAVAHDTQSFRDGLGAHLSRHEVDIGRFPVHTVGDKEIEAAIVVQILETRGPGPIGGSKAGEKSGLQATARAGVEIQRVAFILRRQSGILGVFDGATA